MRLIDLLADAPAWNTDDVAIYVAQPWSCHADAVLISPAPDTTEPVARDGQRYEYFLETFIAKDFMEDFAASNEGRAASGEERCDRLIRYARDDA